ncbi:MAG TPA: hypothetical protein VH640_07375 [Bryobacteraceae bacterium]|jgi:hypothetical protein
MPRRNRRNEDKEDLLEVDTPRFRSYEEEAAWWEKHGARLAEEGFAYLKAKRAEKNGHATKARPVRLRADLQAQLSAVAEHKGVTLDKVVNDLLAKDLAIAEAVRPAAQKPSRARRR